MKKNTKGFSSTGKSEKTGNTAKAPLQCSRNLQRKVPATRRSFIKAAPCQLAPIFDDACVERLAEVCGLSETSDLERFKTNLLEAGLNYQKCLIEPNDNNLHKEISSLHHEAERGDCEGVSLSLTHLSSRARKMLTDRGSIPSLNIQLPGPEIFLDPLQASLACEKVATLCRTGGRRLDRRTNRARNWEWQIFGPEPRRTFEKREAERELLMRLRLAWLEATGDSPSRTAHRHKPGPFARFVVQYLQLLGAGHVDAFSLINNNLQQQRMRRRRL